LTRLVPKLDGPLRIEAYDCDPAAIVNQVIEGTFAGSAAGITRLFAIRADADGRTIQSFEIDELPALVLHCIDGKRSVGAVVAAARRRSLQATPPRAFRGFFEDAVTAGLIRISDRC
jgi:hypothetical protein